MLVLTLNPKFEITAKHTIAIVSFFLNQLLYLLHILVMWLNSDDTVHTIVKKNLHPLNRFWLKYRIGGNILVILAIQTLEVISPYAILILNKVSKVRDYTKYSSMF